MRPDNSPKSAVALVLTLLLAATALGAAEPAGTLVLGFEDGAQHKLAATYRPTATCEEGKDGVVRVEIILPEEFTAEVTPKPEGKQMGLEGKVRRMLHRQGLAFVVTPTEASLRNGKNPKAELISERSGFDAGEIEVVGSFNLNHVIPGGSSPGPLGLKDTVTVNMKISCPETKAE